jgi:hypothetical protein
LRCNETTDPKTGEETSAMNAISFGARKHSGIASDEPPPDKALDAAWIVLEAANDLGDDATVEVCRRVIDADLNGMAASPNDLRIISDYFR